MHCTRTAGDVKNWSWGRESNPHLLVGNQRYYHYTTPAERVQGVEPYALRIGLEARRQHHADQYPQIKPNIDLIAIYPYSTMCIYCVNFYLSISFSQVLNSDKVTTRFVTLHYSYSYVNLSFI